MKISKKNLILFFMISVLVGTVSGLPSISLDAKSQFKVGEEVSFNFSISSDIEEEIHYLILVNCPTAPQPLLEIKTGFINSGEPFIGKYTYLDAVYEGLESQKCNLSLAILEHNLIESREFQIMTSPDFYFNLYSCKDQSCLQKSKIFLLNEDIYFDYFSEVENPDITAMLIYPNEKTKQITLPTSIKAEQVGTYTIEATASKDGYKTITKREQFGVIEKAPDINLVCNYNGICGEDENHKICPADCPATVSDDIYNIEAECGDSVCQIGENYNSCQADCKNALDGICPDESFICDPDCEGFDHIKCKAKTSGTYILIILSAVLIIIAILVIVIIRKRQKRINHKQIGGQKDMLQ